MERIIFQNEHFQFIEYSGTGINDTEYQALKVMSTGKAEEYVVEVRLNFQWLDFNGGFEKYKYYDAVVAYGFGSKSLSLKETEEFIEVLQNGISFARSINRWLDENPEYKA